MEVEEARKQVHRFSREWLELRQVATLAMRQASGLQTIISGYLEMFPELADTDDREVCMVTAAIRARTIGGGPADPIEDDDNAPKGAEAVRVILQANPNAPFYVSELVEKLRQRGWLPDSDNPANAVRTALERMISSSESDVYKERMGGKVVYIYDPDRDPTPPPALTYGSGHEDEEPF